MNFQHPEWFLLFPAILLLGLVVRRLQVFRVLRILCLALVTLVFMSPKLSTQQESLDLWVLFDVSESTEELVTSKSGEWKSLLGEAKPNSDSRMVLMNYAADALKQEPGSETEVYSGSKKFSRTRLALDHVAALASEERPSRVLLFTDGYATEPLAGIADKLNQLDIPLDYRLVRENIDDDYRVARVDMPTRVQVREPFVLGVTVRGYKDGKIPLKIYQNDKQISGVDATVEIVNGVGKVEFNTRLSAAGAYEYKAVIAPVDDTHRGNNTATRWIEVAGGPRVLLVSKYVDDPLEKVLREQGVNVEKISQPDTLKVGRLAGAKAVIINNVPAYEMSTDFLDALDFFVREQGGGLMMVGGKHSFGSGGYFQSSIDALLPISMELKEDHRKLAVAMAIVLDRSGSMGASAGTGTKMDLANSGTENAINLLGHQDSVAVYAVDSETHTIVKQQQIASNKDKMIKRVRRIKSQGGGIYVYTGLKDAWSELKKSPMSTKHVILFADAADAEEPGKYKKLIEEMDKQDATISVIGLGSKRDSDAKFLEDIAKRGKGRIFFTSKAVDIPKLFAQETVTLARSAFIDQPVKVQSTGLWSDISPKAIAWTPVVDGYNLSYARKDATVSLVSSDEYMAPLVAHTRRGIGRTAAVSFPLGGENSEQVRNWKRYGDFVQTISRWLMGSELPPGIGLRHRVEGTLLTVDLLYDSEQWADVFAKDEPVIKILEEGDESSAIELKWKRIAPGHYSLSYELNEGSVVRGAVRVGSQAVSFGPLVVGTSAEWAFDADRVTELRAVSAQTGGRELVDLSEAWLRPAVEREMELRIPLAIALLLFILLDAFVTRTGWTLPSLPKQWKFTKGGKRVSPVAPAKVTPKVEIPKEVDAEAVPKKADESQRRSRYNRAKK